VNTRTQSYLLLLFGGALIRLGATDVLLRYVRPIARPWVLAAGIAIVALAILRLVLAHREGTEHGSAIKIGWLLLAPVIVIVVIAPPALGAFTARRAPVSVPVTGHGDFAPLTGPAPHRLALFDFTTRVLWDSARTVTGQDVALTGFVLNQRPDGFVLARLVITCCAADARAVEVFIHSAEHPAGNDWVTVTGRYAGTDPAEPTFPLIDAATVMAVPAPKNPYD
jgi:uncharacterized repeat protein (TIGR03943 family)